MLTVTINQQKHQFPEGTMILSALRQVGVSVPTLCHDDRLKPLGGCRLCIVEIEGYPNPVTSCNTVLADGMVITTHSETVESLRKTLLKLLARSSNGEILSQSNEKEFYHYLKDYGIEFIEKPKASAFCDSSHPYIHVDMTKCVYCYRCVRICEEVQGQFVWRAVNRGAETRIVPDRGSSLLESSCVSCGACVDTCPTEALIDQAALKNASPDKWTKTTCPYCGTGCEMYVGSRDNKIVRVKPVLEAPVSKGHLCVKGRYAFDFVHAKDRITEPMIRSNGKWQKVSWQEALTFTAKKLLQIIDSHGSDSFAMLGSARASNEENYLAQKFARFAMGTNNVDCCARVCHAPSAAALKAVLGTGAATNSFEDIELAKTILVAGSNATENHPIVGARIRQAALRGVPLIVIDPRKIELANIATIHLQIKPGTNLLAINSLAATIVEEALFDRDFINERVSGFEEFCDFIKSYRPELVAQECGVSSDDLRAAARLYAQNSPSICLHGLGMTEHVQGSEGVMALINLALLTGNLGKRGTGINPLRGQNNVQGSAQMGCEPGNLTGFISLDAGRELFESVWKGAIPTERGLNLLEMMDAASSGSLKALWTIGYDILLTNANTKSTSEALSKLDLIIVQDMFLNETAKEYGTVFFPAASSFEKDGTFMNGERRIQRIRKAIEPIGESKSDWEIICLLAQAMGRVQGFVFDSAEAIWNEIRQVWKAAAGISYERIERAGICWPCPDEEHPGTLMLHAEKFPIGKQARLRCIDYRPTKEVTTSEFPFILNTGRTLHQFNAGTMTMRTDNRILHPTDFLDISPEDALAFGLQDGEMVKVESIHGRAKLPVRINQNVKVGQLFATFHDPIVFLNSLTSPYRDTITHTPEYKVTAVRIEPETS